MMITSEDSDIAELHISILGLKKLFVEGVC